MLEKHKIQILPYLIIWYEIAIYLSNDMYLPSMPAIAKDLSFTDVQTQYTLIFWFLGASTLQIILGPLSDRFGRRIILLLGAIAFVIASAACAIADSLFLLLLARFVQGTSLCSLVAANAAIHELYSTKQAIKYLALIGAVTILAPALGPMFGAVIVQFATWRDIFWFLLFMGVVSLFSIILFMPESNKQQHPLHLQKFFNDYKKLLINRNFIIPNLAYCFLVAMYFVWIFKAPFLMIQVFETTPLYYGLSQTVIFSFYFVGAAATKWLLDRYSVKKLILFSVVITIAGAILFIASSILYNNLELAIICMVIISFGTSMLYGPINRIAIESATAQPMGSRTAIFSTLVSLFGVLIGYILTIVESNTLGQISILCTVCIAIAILLIAIMNIPQFQDND